MMKFLTRWLLVAAIVIWPSIGRSALPNQLKTARMTDSTLASAIDNEVGNLETAVCDILGIPCNTNVSNALFVVTASGLTNVVFQDLVGSPTAAGRLARNAANLEFHDGTAARVLANAANTLTLTNKTIALGSNTVSGTTAQFNTALTDNDFGTLAGIETFTNKTVNLASNTLSGTTAQFNTALSDNDFATLAGTETLSNKTLTTPTISATGWINANHAHTAANSGGVINTGSTLACSNDTEGTTTSTTITNVVTVSGCSIGVNNGILIIASLRKTTGALAEANVALKLNTTQVTATQIWTSSVNTAQSGMLVAYVGPHDATYLRGGFIQVNKGGGANVLQEGFNVDVPNATITDVVIMGSVNDAAITMGVKYVKVYQLSGT